MITPPIYSDEAARLEALKRYEVLDTPASDEFDDFTRLASEICGMPIALISLVDVDRQWFKSKVGLDANETSRDSSFCAHAIHGRELFEIQDVLTDERFRDNPLVAGAPHIRFYAGQPLITPEGFGIGTLCVIDHIPRKLDGQQRDMLKVLARLVVQQLELRITLLREKKINTELAAESAFRKSLMHSSDMAMISADAVGGITSFNFGAERISGFHSGDVTGKKTLDDLFEWEADSARTAEHSANSSFSAAVRAFEIDSDLQQSQTLECLLRGKSGTRVPVKLILSKIRFEEQSDDGMLIVAIDISKRRHIEQQLETTCSEQRLQNETLIKVEGQHKQLLHKLQIGIVVHAPDSTIIFSNPRASELLGLTEAQLHGKASIDPAWCFLKEDGTPFQIEDYPVSIVIATGLPMDERILGISSPSHDAVVWVAVSAFPEIGESGQLMAIVVNFHDVTERKKNENLLLENQRQLKNILDTCPTAARITKRGGGRYHYYNSQYLALTNNTDQTINNFDPSTYYDQKTFSEIQNILSRGENITGRLVELRKPSDPVFGVKWALASYFNILYENEPATLAWFHDITERIRLEKMKGEFISTVSHELRTPLTSITGSLGLIFNEVFGKLPPQVHQMIEVAHRNSLRLTFMINDLLDMDKLVAGKMTFDIREHFVLPIVSRSIEDNSNYMSERHIRLIFDVPPDLHHVRLRCDEQRFLQVLSNLLSNAIKFSPDHGEVLVTCGLSTENSDQINIAVSDQGPGIPLEFQQRIFQKFSQADSSDVRQKGGTGLGLAISRELVEQMGGAIGFTSVAGEGSCFYVTFPVIQPKI